MERPIVSIVIPTFNQPSLLLEALNSVFRQTYDRYEVIVVDDGSTDDTLNRLASIAHRVRVIAQSNQGIGSARNRGVAESFGKYIAFLDHDDLWMPDKLRLQVEMMERDSALVGCSVPYAFSTTPGVPAFDPAIATPNGKVTDALSVYANGNMFMFSSAMMVRGDIARELKFETERCAFEDLPYHLRLLLKGPYGIAGREVQVVYRVHSGNMTRSAQHFYDGMRHLRMLERTGAFGPLSPSESREVQRFISTFGRISVATQLALGRRLGAFRSYLQELPFQVREGRFMFLVGFPLMAALAPTSVARRLFAVHAKSRLIAQTDSMPN